MEDLEGESTNFYVNAKQQVRPKRYKRRVKRARLGQKDQLNVCEDHTDIQKVDTAKNGEENCEYNPYENGTSQVDYHHENQKDHSDYHNERLMNQSDSNHENQTDNLNYHHENQTDPLDYLYENQTDPLECLHENQTDQLDYLHENQTDQLDYLHENHTDPLDYLQNGEPVQPNCSNENVLIDYIKHQEDTLLDSLFADLDNNIKQSTRTEEDSENDENDEIPFIREEGGQDAPVQPGHWLTLHTSVLLIWIFAMTHSLTSSQLTDLLTLINLHLLPSNPALGSLYRFKTFFSNLEMPANKHYFCANCYSSVTSEQFECSNHACQKDLRKTSSKEYFLELDIVSQLKHFYSRQEFEEGIKYKFSRNKQKKNNIEDVYDSQQYINLSKNDGPLSKPNNLSFVFNTDGVPIFKSSKTAIWPIFLIINELPYKMRKSRKYMILAGLWCGSIKPSMNLFLSPMCKTLNELEKGVEITTYSKIKIKVQGFMLSMSCDLPARSAVLNINQHNGEGCCIKCLQLGKNHRTSTGGNIRVFEYKKENPTGPVRTHESIMNDAEKVTTSKSKHLNGIKGPSIVMFCPHVDGVKSVAIDYMHLVCLGTVRLLLKLWFNISHSLNSFSLYRFKEIVDLRLEDIKPPHFISRQPRSISEHLKFWKASELRSWFLFYSIPCIADLLPPVFLYHYCTFLEGVFLLCKSSISHSDIERSEKLLRYFVFMFASLYGEKYITINVHSLLHLPQTVRELGPLWTYSCFSFEDANGELLQLFHGTQSIDLQIVNAVHVFQMLPVMSQTISRKSIAFEFVNKLTKQQECVDLAKFSLLGKPYQKNVSEELKLCIIKVANEVHFDINFYSRAIVRGVLYQSLDYTRVSKRNSYTVRYLNNKKSCYGYIKWFADVSNKDSFQIACIKELLPKKISLFQMHHQKITPDELILENFLGVEIPHVHFFQKSENECIVSTKNIFELCICIEMKDCVVVCDEPNHHERNL